MPFDIDVALRFVVSTRAPTCTSRCPLRRWPGSTASCARLTARRRWGPRTRRPRSAHIANRPGSAEEFDRERRGRLLLRDQGPVAASASTPSASAATISIVCARSPSRFAPSRTSGCRRSIRTLAEQPRGIVLLTGTTGSGKSTTLAAMIDHINRTWPRHIVTLEDPIEYLHRDKRSIINQREVGQDTESFGRAMRRVLRQDPDVILVGEMRDEETVRTALSAAETGPPRALDAAHPRRDRDRQPDHRLLPAPSPAAGAGDAGVDASRRRRAAARAAAAGARAAWRSARCSSSPGGSRT